MRFYYDIFYKNGNRNSGHNCTRFVKIENQLVLEGFDDVGDERKHWRFYYDLADIKEFRIEPMREEEDYGI